MGDVVRWPRHLRWNCTREHEDGGWSCGFCTGGLFSCVTCGGAEGSLTTHCSQEPLTPEMEQRVLAGALDYRVEEGWVVLRPSVIWRPTPDEHLRGPRTTITWDEGEPA